ncbi:hypothetical protein BLOT_015857 [Blomia tropicalis]|nr:hypothetical protein BLOT_015857 [Blomia tropicalis]
MYKVDKKIRQNYEINGTHHRLKIITMEKYIQLIKSQTNWPIDKAKKVWEKINNKIGNEY